MLPVLRSRDPTRWWSAVTHSSARRAASRSVVNEGNQAGRLSHVLHTASGVWALRWMRRPVAAIPPRTQRPTCPATSARCTQHDVAADSLADCGNIEPLSRCRGSRRATRRWRASTPSIRCAGYRAPRQLQPQMESRTLGLPMYIRPSRTTADVPRKRIAVPSGMFARLRPMLLRTWGISRNVARSSVLNCGTG